MIPKKYIALALVLLPILLIASPLGDDFTARIRNTQSNAEAAIVINEMLPQMSQLEDFRTVQNYWMELDSEACREYFRQRHLQAPGDPQMHYLWTRTLEDPVLYISESRDLVTEAPEFYWAYRSLSGAYLNHFFDAEADSSLTHYVSMVIDSDMALLEIGLQKFPTDDYILVTLMNYKYYRDDLAQAGLYAMRLSDPSAIQANYQAINELIITSGNMQVFDTLFPKLVSSMVRSRQVEPQDSLAMLQYYRLDTLRKIENWQILDQYLADNPQIMTDARMEGILIEIYISRAMYDRAFELVNSSFERGDISLRDLEDSSRWGALSTQERFQELVQRARLEHETALPQIRAAAIANRKNTPAPLWNLPDMEGNLVSLESLRGQIIILDFWATWCSPCRMSMPIIDSWMKSRMPEGVKVFSVNVWERNPEAAKAYIRENNFAMTYLAGDRELSGSYGFDGIPYICVIDQEGNLAWDHTGYSEELEDILGFWVQELLSDGGER